MKRKIRCGTCQTTKNSATGKTLYLLSSDNHYMLHTFTGDGECWDCGEKRREAEEKKRQAHLSRLIEDDE